jgi:hypothetical protein
VVPCNILVVGFRHTAFAPAEGAKANYKEKEMKRISMLPAMAILLVLVFATVPPAKAQDQSGAAATTLPAPKEVAPGTRFLIRIESSLSTQNAKAGQPFRARTLDSLVSADGTTLPPGAEIRGHVDKVDAAHQIGRARLWLTFDDIRTPDGWLPFVAVVDDVPGVHSIRVDYDREGEIEANSSKRRDALDAAAAGAFVGAAAGVASHNGKDAATGAAIAAATAFMVASGLGQEVTLAKDTKVEVVLERSLYLGRT